MFACLLSAFCDFVKEQKLLELYDEVNNQKVIVYRGAYGTASSISIQDIVVGDVVQLTQGDRVPADCIILDEIDLVIDQSMYSKKLGQDRVVKKESIVVLDEQNNVVEDNHQSNPDNILLANSKVMKGEAKVLVCCVGEHTLMSRSRKKEQLVLKEAQTELEDRLEKISKSIEQIALDAMALCFITQIIYVVIKILVI